MSAVRRSICKATAGDPVVRGLGYALWAAPLAVATVLIWQMLAHGPARTPVAAEARLGATTIEKPIMTQAILRPRRDTAVATVAETFPSRDELAAVAFMSAPNVSALDLARLSGSKTSGETSTASIPSAGPGRSIRAAARENRGWRMETLRNVGVADGLKLISDGALLSLAGVEPLARDSLCTRLDGVQEPCAMRAASRLEVLTRGRTVTCRVYEPAAGEPAIASCRADKIDLADDLVKNGLARRAG